MQFSVARILQTSILRGCKVFWENAQISLASRSIQHYNPMCRPRGLARGTHTRGRVMRVDAEWLQDEIYWMVFHLLDDEIDVSGDDAGEMAAAAAEAAVETFERIMADESESVCEGVE
jgi:hypothetical protein